MQDENLSQWFNLDEQKPWEPGVYEVQRQDYDYVGQFSLFKNGKFHEVGVRGPDSAICWAEKFGIGDGGDVVKWRGLASDPSAKPKPNARGNRKVTRYVVMAQHKITMAASCDGSFESKKNAESRMAQTLKICGDTHRMWIQKVRFLTPEAA